MRNRKCRKDRSNMKETSCDELTSQENEIPQTQACYLKHKKDKNDLKYGIVYSYNNAPGQPEFFTVDVPRTNVRNVDALIMFLAPLDCRHGEMI